MQGLRQRVLAGEVLAGTFLKTPAYEMVEVLAHSGLDFICLDAEHAPFDRGRMDACLAMARALGLPALVRVPSGTPENILSALDSGAVGIVAPHVSDVPRAEAIARAARFGSDGRGFAGSTRWADYTTQSIPDLLARSAEETLVIVQIEDPASVEAAGSIAAVEGVDALFLGPSDLSVAMGKTNLGSPELQDAYRRVGTACRAHAKGYASWVPAAEAAPALRPHGVSMFFVASEHAWALAGGRATADALKGM